MMKRRPPHPLSVSTLPRQAPPRPSRPSTLPSLLPTRPSALQERHVSSVHPRAASSRGTAATVPWCRAPRTQEAYTVRGTAARGASACTRASPTPTCPRPSGRVLAHAMRGPRPCGCGGRVRRALRVILLAYVLTKSLTLLSTPDHGEAHTAVGRVGDSNPIPARGSWFHRVIPVSIPATAVAALDSSA